MIFGILLIIFPSKDSVNCQRNTFNLNTGYCVIEKSNFLRSEIREIPLEKIQEAKFIFEPQNNQDKKKNNSEDTRELKSQVVLVMNDKNNKIRDLSVNSDFNPHYKSQALQKKINSFLDDTSQEKLEVISKDNHHWITAGFVSLFTAAYTMSRKK